MDAGEPKPGELITPQNWKVERCSEGLVSFVGLRGFVHIKDLLKVGPGVWKLIDQAAIESDTLDQLRLKKQIVDKDGIRNAADDLPTNENTDDLPMEDPHEELP